MDTICMRKLQLFGHVCRMPDDRLLKRHWCWNGRRSTMTRTTHTMTRTTHTAIDWRHFKRCNKSRRHSNDNRRPRPLEKICWVDHV